MQQKKISRWYVGTHYIIQRNDILSFINTHLSNLTLCVPVAHMYQHTSHQRPAVVNIHGIGGIGKSLMLRQIFEHFQETYTIIWWNFNQLDHAHDPELVLVWKEVVPLLRQTLDSPHIPETIQIKQKDGTEQETQLQLMCQVSLSKESHFPIIILLDSVDEIDGQCWKWLQQHVIKPLLDIQQVLIVCTSQSPVIWHFWEIRDQGVLFDAPPFSFEETKDYLHLSNRELLAKPLYDLTLGYPLALDTIMALFDYEGETDWDAGLTSLSVLDQYYMTSDARNLIVERGIGIIRRVEKRLLRQIVTEQVVETNPVQIEQWITSTLFELKAQKCLAAYRKGQPLRFVVALRRAIEQWQQTYYIHSYLSLCTQLAEIYYQRFSQQPITEMGAFNEWLYFSASIANINPEDRYLENWTKRLWDVLINAQNKGKRLRPYWFDEVVVALYKDGELMQHLRTSNLFATVHHYMHDMVGNRHIELPVLNDSETVEYCEQVLHRLIKRLPEERHDDLDAFHPGGLMKSIAELQPHLNTVSLRNSINAIREVLQLDPLNPGYVSRAVAFLNSRGFFPSSDKQAHSRYQLNRLISKLALLPQELAL